MAKDEKAKTQTENLDLKEITLQAFDNYVQVKYPNQEAKNLPQDELDETFKDFQVGFHSGLIQAAGEILGILGINLNVILSKAQSYDKEHSQA